MFEYLLFYIHFGLIVFIVRKTLHAEGWMVAALQSSLHFGMLLVVFFNMPLKKVNIFLRILIFLTLSRILLIAAAFTKEPFLFCLLSFLSLALQAPVISSSVAIYKRWFPAAERNQILSLCNTFAALVIIFFSFIGGRLLDSNPFYYRQIISLTAGVTLIAVFLFCCYGFYTDNPQDGSFEAVKFTSILEIFRKDLRFCLYTVSFSLFGIANLIGITV
ncbi:MFS transporter [Candidatus Riflebacteria bacterium]